MGSRPELTRIVGTDQILIKLSSRDQLSRINTIKHLKQYPAVVHEHHTLNYIQGTFYSEGLANHETAEVLEMLKPQGVIRLSRMKKRGVFLNRYIVTFKGNFLPKRIDLQYIAPTIQPYIPLPMRCYRCQRLGHTKQRCRRETDACGNCCEEGHTSGDCSNSPNCINCGGPHSPASTSCPQYNRAKLILAKQHQECISRYEAEKIIEDSHPFSSTYAGILQRNPHSTSQPQSSTLPTSSNTIYYFSNPIGSTQNISEPTCSVSSVPTNNRFNLLQSSPTLTLDNTSQSESLMIGESSGAIPKSTPKRKPSNTKTVDSIKSPIYTTKNIVSSSVPSECEDIKSSTSSPNVSQTTTPPSPQPMAFESANAKRHREAHTSGEESDSYNQNSPYDDPRKSRSLSSSRIPTKTHTKKHRSSKPSPWQLMPPPKPAQTCVTSKTINISVRTTPRQH